MGFRVDAIGVLIGQLSIQVRLASLCQILQPVLVPLSRCNLQTLTDLLRGNHGLIVRRIHGLIHVLAHIPATPKRSKSTAGIVELPVCADSELAKLFGGGSTRSYSESARSRLVDQSAMNGFSSSLVRSGLRV